jgi:tRNA pseudouridine38-40 synthase
MRAGAAHLVGKHDFTSFRATECQAKSPVRTLDQLDIVEDGPNLVFVVSARSFLHHQVRNMVGTLILVGRGKWRSEQVAEALAAQDRTAAGPTAPPDGLYLVAVDYA